MSSTGPNEPPSGKGTRRVRSRVAAAMLVGIARLRSRPGRTALVLVGIGAATAMLVVVFGSSLIARERALQRAIGALPADQRSFRVDLVGLPVQQQYARVDRAASTALSTLAPGEPLRVGFFRDFWLDGEFVRLVGIDRLRDYVQLRSGRLPRACRPQACEVLQIGAQGRRVLREGDIHLVRVGTADLRNVRLFGAAFEHLRQYRAQASLVRSTLLLAPDASSFERLPALQLLQRARSWVAPIDPSTIRSWQVDSLLDRETRVQTLLSQADPAFTLSGPDTALLEARDQGDISSQRMVLVGGAVSALLLGFALVAAAGLRRGLATERRRLLQRGATRAQIWLAVLTEIGVVTLAGWLAGIAVGVLGIGVLARVLGLPVGGVLAHALLERGPGLVLAGAWVVATAVVIVTALLREAEAGDRRLRLLDVAALAAVLAVVVGLARGSLSADTLAAGGDRTFLLLLPGLLCVVAAVVAARLLGPLMRVGERLSRKGPLAFRLALISLARAPARTALTGAFLVVSVGLALFAAGYRATLERGARDEAGFASPFDVALTEGAKLKEPLDVASLSRYEHLAPSVRAYPLLRTSADVPGQGTIGQGVTVLGVPAQGLEHMYWRSDFAPISRSHLARALSEDGPATLRGPVLPKGSAKLRVRVDVTGTPIQLALALQDSSRRIRFVSLGRLEPGARTVMVGVGRRSAEGRLRIVALEAYLANSERNWFFHLAHEGRSVQAPAGSVRLGRLAVTDRSGQVRSLVGWRGWVARNGGTVGRTGGETRLSYAFPEVRTILLRPHEPTDGRPLPIVASPDVARAAGPGGLVTLDFVEPPVRARVVGIADRFPTVQPGEPFAVAEETQLATALDADAPGTGRPGELWLSAPSGSLPELESALARPPFSALERTYRRRILSSLENDPLARAIEYTLEVAALLTLALAVIGLWATLLSDLRDERSDFFDLEAQGVAPETLRRHLRLRALALLGFGALGGSVLGFVLSRLVVSLVEVSAETSSPVPPLVFSPGWAGVGLVLAVLAITAAAAAELSTRHAFHGETPERASWELE